MGETIVKAIDELTDLGAITAIGVLALNGSADPTVVAAIVSVAFGQRYAKGKWLQKA